MASSDLHKAAAQLRKALALLAVLDRNAELSGIPKLSGRYGRPDVLADEAAFTAALDGPVRDAIADGREVRITDPGDMLLFHAKDGAIVFPTAEQCR